MGLRIKEIARDYPLVYEEIVFLIGREGVSNIEDNSIQNEYLIDTFTWSNSPQGFNFWSMLYHNHITEAKELEPTLFIDHRANTTIEGIGRFVVTKQGLWKPKIAR